MKMDVSDSESDDSGSTSGSEDYSSFDRSIEVARSPSREDLVDFLECPVCFELPFPPIRTCIQGHIICAECCCRLNKCPLCQQRIDIGRNFFAEHFLNKSVIKCKFQVDGCSSELPGEKLKAHMLVCGFRPLKCRDCSTRVAFADFENHMLIQHGVGRYDLNEQGVRIVMSQKQRHRIGHGRLAEASGVSMKFICTSIIITAMFTIIGDYFYSSMDYSIF